MSDHADSLYLLELYRNKVRPFLTEHAPGDLAPLDRVTDLLEAAVNKSETLTVGFVGEAQVGKSTLINALLKRRTLPSGGIGPLTARATRVSYSPDNALSVMYHGRRELNQLTFAVNNYLQRRGEISKAPSLAEAGATIDGDGDLDARLDEAGAEPTDDQRSDKGDYMLAQARRLLTEGTVSSDENTATNVEILSALRRASQPSVPAEATDRFSDRIAEIRGLLGRAEEIAEADLPSPSVFRKALRERASGWRSPLIRQLHVRLNDPTLRGMTLVDLPGIGVLHDAAAQQAEEFVSKEGDALVVVFRNSGITENVAHLLERTGVITQLLFGGRQDVPAIELILAVTHVDNVAEDRYRTLRDESEDTGQPAPRRSAVFREVAKEMEDKIREQLANALRQSPSFDDISKDRGDVRERVIANLCGRMEVITVAAPDFLALRDTREDYRGFLDNEADTGVQHLEAHLAILVQASATRRREAITQFDTLLRESIRERLSALVHIYQEGRGVAIQDWERFRDGLAAVAEPLRREMHAYHGESIGILREGIGNEIQILCADAEIAGRKKLARLTRDSKANQHFMSLRAALNRNGVWDRRGIDYPDAITRAMVDSIATDWSPKVIEQVRNQVKTLAARDAELVERLCSTAREMGTELVVDAAIEAQRKVLQSASKAAVAWTKEQLEVLRETVRQSLRSAVAAPIENACKNAIRLGRQFGKGAKDRILSTFEEGGEAAIGEARQAAEKVLKSEYKALLRRLDEGFLRENSDPVHAALEMLSGQQVEKARHADAERKAMILSGAGEIEALLSTASSHVVTPNEKQSWHFVHA